MCYDQPERKHCLNGFVPSSSGFLIRHNSSKNNFENDAKCFEIKQQEKNADMVKRVFINCSNHPSGNWGSRQRIESEKYGEIIDVPFPKVDPQANETEIQHLADQVVEIILKHTPEAVMCQGEFTLTFAIVRRLQERDVKVLSACSERRVTEMKMTDGTAKKEAVFEFIRYREYR